MGRPGKKKDDIYKETQKEDRLKFKKSLAGKGEKQKTFRSFKKSGGLQKSIGNASSGNHYFVFCWLQYWQQYNNQYQLI